MSVPLPIDEGEVLNTSQTSLKNYSFWERFYKGIIRGDIVKIPPLGIVGVFFSLYSIDGFEVIFLAYDWTGRAKVKSWVLPAGSMKDVSILVRREEIEGQTVIASIEYFKENYADERRRFFGKS